MSTAATSASQKTARKVATPDDDTQWSRRQSVPVTYHTGDVTEQEDIVQMIVDPNSNIAQAQAKAMRRAHDDEIIRAAINDSRDGNGDPVTFPTDQQIGDTGSAVPFTFDLVTQVTEMFMTLERGREQQW